MPRHRPSGTARHAARNRQSWFDRAVLGAVRRRVLARRAPAVHAAASAARRVPVARAAAIVARLKLRKIIRLVAFTPWLTASFGVVAAATVALAVPHPAITLPPAADGTCVSVSCHIGHRIHTDAAPKPRG